MISDAKIRDADIIPVQMNWNDGVQFTLEYLTEIRTFRSGREERDAVRDRPRGMIQFSFLATGALARQFRADLMAKPNGEWWVPIPGAKLEPYSSIIAAATQVYVGDSDWLRIGDHVVVESGQYQFLRQVTAFAGGNITVAPIPIALSNIKVSRVVKCLISNRTKLAMVASDVMRGQLEFEICADQLSREDEFSGPAYLGREIVFKRPNWGDGVELSFARRMEEIDFGFGPKIRQELSQVSENTSSLDLYGLDHNAALDLIELCQRMVGKRNSFWYPAYERDIVALSNSARTSTTLSVSGDHFAAQRDSQTHRYLLFIFADQTYAIRRVNTFNIGVGVSALVMNSSVGSRFDMNTTRIYWLVLRRSASDSFEFEFVTKTIAKTKLAMVSLPVSEVE